MEDPGHGAWNPGLESVIPARLISSATLYRPENAHTSAAEARDAGEFCGCPAAEMVDFTFDRLVVHEVLIRTTADLHVPDGPDYQELGVNLRRLADEIITREVAPNRTTMRARYAALVAELDAVITRRLAADLERSSGSEGGPAPPTPRKGFWNALFPRPAPTRATAAPKPDDRAIIGQWRREAAGLPEGVERACLEALAFVCRGILRSRGALPADHGLIARLAGIRARATFGSQQVGAMIDPLIAAAAARGEYEMLAAQDMPVVLNVKGASASGKSTLRNRQRELAERLGIDWSDFALVSPDYWRKYLLDYGSLGADYKYAAMLTGQELELIDRKLDAHFSRKAAAGRMPHLLIDRFRFDSFGSRAGDDDVGNMLSRFGKRIFIFFLITPPAATVERAWKRGRTTGRYKSVDDLLFHNIEAYTGMPRMFFTWSRKREQEVHFEFLDNSVPLGSAPRTVAFGWNSSLTVLDPETLREMRDYRNVNVDAQSPEAVLVTPPASQADFLAECIEHLKEVVFVDLRSGATLGVSTEGRCTEQSEGFFSGLALGAACSECALATDATALPAVDRAAVSRFLVGAWPSV